MSFSRAVLFPVLAFTLLFQSQAFAMSESCRSVFDNLHALDLGYSGQVPFFLETVKSFEQQVVRDPSLKDCRDDYGTSVIGAALTTIQMCPLLFVAERLIDMGFKVDEPDRFDNTPIEGAAEWHAVLFMDLKKHKEMKAPHCFAGFAPPKAEVSEKILRTLIAKGVNTSRVNHANESIARTYEFMGLEWDETLKALKN